MSDVDLKLSICSPEREWEIFPLLAKCFPEYWAPRMEQGMTAFPFKLESIITELEGRIVGHIGLFQFPVHLGGGIFPAGGVVAVAVDPECRGMGIAGKMCGKLLDIYRERKVFFSPLYTGLPKVYTRGGWNIYGQFKPYCITGEGKSENSVQIYKSTVPENVQNKIMDIYVAGWNFDGKVVREKAGVFNSWARLFGSQDYIWLVAGNSYALMNSENCLMEVYGNESYEQLLRSALHVAEGELTIYLPEGHAMHQLIKESASQLAAKMPDPCHGESAMINIINEVEADKACFTNSLSTKNFFFPLADKF
jgi:GNAT superfamily N-acetyltransferase